MSFPQTEARRRVEVAGPPVVFGGKHLRIMVRQSNRTLVLKAWNFAARAGGFTAGARIDIAFTLEEDAYSASRGYPGWCAVLREARRQTGDTLRNSQLERIPTLPTIP